MTQYDFVRELDVLLLKREEHYSALSSEERDKNLVQIFDFIVLHYVQICMYHSNKFKRMVSDKLAEARVINKLTDKKYNLLFDWKNLCCCLRCN